MIITKRLRYSMAKNKLKSDKGVVPMTLVTLDGNKMIKEDDVHPYLKTQLNINEYYGNNLDALWDALSSFDRPLHIELIHAERMLKQAGNYGKSLIKVFEEAETENPNIHFRVIE